MNQFIIENDGNSTRAYVYMCVNIKLFTVAARKFNLNQFNLVANVHIRVKVHICKRKGKGKVGKFFFF